MTRYGLMKKLYTRRVRKSQRPQREIEQPKSPVANNLPGSIIASDTRSAAQPIPSHLSPDLIDSLGQMKGNHHVLSILPSIQLKKQISTPVSKELKPKKDGSVTMVVNDTTVTIHPDERTTDEGMADRAETSINIAPYDFPEAETSDGKVVKLIGSTTIKHHFTIRTIYGPDVTAKSKSAYGRGTTKDDITAGHTSLGFHEGNHGLDFIAYLKNQQLPKFTGKVGMSEQAYQTAMDVYKGKITAYMTTMDNTSQKETDCVGHKADFCIEQPAKK